MKAASGLAAGRTAEAALAAEAVTRALERAAADHAESVLLFLSSEFAKAPDASLRAAARAAGCTQIVGCTAPGIFTDEDWVLDAPAAAALVITEGARLVPARSPAADDLVLTLAAPTALTTAWLTDPGVRFGAVAGDASGQGAYSVWMGSRVAARGRVEAVVSGARGHIAVARGVEPLSDPLEITQVSGFDVLTLRQQPALNSLSRELPAESRNDRLPLPLLMAGVIQGDTENAIAEGRFNLLPVIAANLDDRSVTLSRRLRAGERLFWAIRRPIAAERDMRATLARTAALEVSDPAFSLLFPCMGRGPYFFGGVDRDVEALKETLPGVPFVGFYGNGEIGPLEGVNQLLQYSAVLGLFYDV